MFFTLIVFTESQKKLKDFDIIWVIICADNRDVIRIAIRPFMHLAIEYFPLFSNYAELYFHTKQS